MRLVVMLGLLLNLGAWAGEVCVRNYLGSEPNSPCVTFPATYEYVVVADKSDKKICARIYPEFECALTKEYEWVKTSRGGKICTLNYHQPPVSRLCKDAPDYYDWAQGD